MLKDEDLEDSTNHCYSDPANVLDVTLSVQFDWMDVNLDPSSYFHLDSTLSPPYLHDVSCHSIDDPCKAHFCDHVNAPNHVRFLHSHDYHADDQNLPNLSRHVDDVAPRTSLTVSYSRVVEFYDHQLVQHCLDSHKVAQQTLVDFLALLESLASSRVLWGLCHDKHIPCQVALELELDHANGIDFARADDAFRVKFDLLACTCCNALPLAVAASSPFDELGDDRQVSHEHAGDLLR